MLKSNWIKMGLILFKISVILSVLLISIILLTKKEVKMSNDEKIYVISASLKQDMVLEEQEEIKTEKKVYYTGDLTGYAADCPMCNGTLGCLPSYKVYRNGVLTYPDNTYGNVRIVASSKSLACGSIIKFESARVDSSEVYAIVLDRGVLNRDIDLLVPTEEYAYNYIGRSKITYEVLRYGW